MSIYLVGKKRKSYNNNVLELEPTEVPVLVVKFNAKEDLVEELATKVDVGRFGRARRLVFDDVCPAGARVARVVPLAAERRRALCGSS